MNDIQTAILAALSSFCVSMIGFAFIVIKQLWELYIKRKNQQAELDAKRAEQEIREQIDNGEEETKTRRIINTAADRSFETIRQMAEACQEEIREVRERLDEATLRINGMGLEREQLKNTVDRLNTQLQQTMHELASARLELANARLEAQTYERRLEKAQQTISQMSDTNRELLTQVGVLEERLRGKTVKPT